MKKVFLYLVFILFFGGGCQTTQSSSQQHNSLKDNQEAVEAIVEAITGKELSDSEKADLMKQLQKDKEAQSAIQAIADSLDSTKSRIKYSPATGKRYSPDLEVDPETGVKLEWVQQ